MVCRGFGMVPVLIFLNLDFEYVVFYSANIHLDVT